MEEQFLDYVNNYDMENNHVKNKYNHSIRVEKICEALAQSLNFNDEDINIIKIIGLLHEIGRFEQLKIVGEYNDTELDHGDYGVKLLFENKLIEKFDINPNYYDIIEFAIQNHNKYKIADTDDERKLMFAKLIRDADKIDKFDAYTYLKAYNIANIDDDVTNEVAIQFRKHELINRKIRKTKADLLISVLAFVFDINFKESLEIIYEQKYLDELYNQIENADRFKVFFEYANDYIKERVEHHA